MELNMITAIYPNRVKKILIILALGLVIFSFIFSHYRLHYIEKAPEYITVIDKKKETSDSYSGIIFFGFMKIQKNEPRYFLYLTTSKEKFSIRYGKEQLESIITQKKRVRVSQTDYEKYTVGDVLIYSENTNLWNDGTLIVDTD